jgi:tripartite-type tricarboxylate transporter receptor subunit TctC
LLADNKLVALASAGPSRTAYLPQVPTVIESGLKDYEVTSWNGLSAPAATPARITTVLNQAMKEVMPSADIQTRSAEMGMAMRWSTPGEMTARMKADMSKWSSKGPGSPSATKSPLGPLAGPRQSAYLEATRDETHS